MADEYPETVERYGKDGLPDAVLRELASVAARNGGGAGGEPGQRVDGKTAPRGQGFRGAKKDFFVGRIEMPAEREQIEQCENKE